MKNDLSSLIYPASLENFFDFFDRGEPFCVETDPSSVAPLSTLPFLDSLQALLSFWSSSVQVHLPDVRDESSSIDSNSQDAYKLYQNGMGLLFNEAQSLSPVLSEWLEGIRRELGLSALTQGRCLIYATPDGKGTSPHFDQNINFVLQLKGTKKWKMAPNHHVMNPLTRHTMGQEADPELSGYLEAPLPTSMPKDALSFVLRPGTLLFVPRGYWHSTEAEGDALALNFTFTAPTWLDLFSAALRSRLALSPEWRETAQGFSIPERQGHAERHFDFLLSNLVPDLPNWRALDILGVTEMND